MKISATDVTYVAQLANLDVADNEKEELAAQLSRIVQYVEQLETLDTDSVEPTAQIVARETHAEREDAVKERDGSSETAETVGLFRVPKVINVR
jgi:aspartyl-tRNA(Asn)/glutamyl-tRNA(Gln) amidotransferase subunit C